MVTLIAAELTWLYRSSAALVAVMAQLVGRVPGAIRTGVMKPVVGLIEQVSGVVLANVTAPVPVPPVVVTTSVRSVSAMID
jgi:hypothetical protein